MTVTGAFLAIVLAALALIAFGVIGFAAGLSLFAYLKRHEIRRTVAAFRTTELRVPSRNDWEGARLRPEDLRRPDGPEGSARGPTS